MADAYVFELPTEPPPDDWLRVSGGDLAQPVALRIQIAGQAVRIIGLRIDNDQPITSSQLRIRLLDIAQALYSHLQQMAAGFERAEAAHATSLKDGAPPTFADYLGHLAGRASSPELEAFAGMVDAALARQALERWIAQLEVEEASAAGALRTRGPGAKPPSSDELRLFAATYLRELSKGKRGAKARTATAVSMNRSTVYRWITLCQQAGYLPEGGDQ